MSLQPFVPGDIFITDSDLDESARFPTGMGKVRQYDRDWNLKATHETGQRGLISSLALDHQQRLHILDPQATWLGTIAPDGEPVDAFPNLPRAGYGSMIPCPEGYILGEHLVGEIPGFSGKGHAYRIDADGTVRAEWTTQTNGGVGGFLGVTHMALSSDGTTLYHVSETGAHVYAHQLAGDCRLGPVYTRDDPPPFVFGLAGLPDDSLLLACATEVRQIRPGKGVERVYQLPPGRGWAIVELRPDGTSFWALDFFGGQLVSVNIASGAIELHKELGLKQCLTGIAEVPTGDNE